MEKIRKGDQVVVITGKDKGKRGTVLRRVGDEHVLVEGVNRAKKHVKPNPARSLPGGIEEREAPLHISNVAVFNAATQKADRVGYKTEGETKVRVFKSSGDSIADAK